MCAAMVTTGEGVTQQVKWPPFALLLIQNISSILVSHGFAENQLCLWKYPTMSRVKEFKGHTARVLHMATSPDGSMVCSGSADETLRFWNIFASEGKKKVDSFPAAGGFTGINNSMKIR